MAINFENRYSDVSGPDELHLSDYLRTIVRGWRTIVMVTLIALALGCAYAFLAPPTYRADVLFHVEDKTANANANGKDSLPPLTGMFDTKPSTAAEIELLKSRLVTEETVKNLHLDISAAPRTLPFIGGMIAGLVNGQWGFKLPSFINLSDYAWGDESIAVSRFDTSKDFYDTTFTLIAGDGGSYVLRDKNGIAILSGHVGETVETDTADGPIALHVDKLVGAPGSRFELRRASTLGTVDRLQKALVVAETTLQS
ncbi:MAG: tyrosine-protein kinase Etk/Wzc, partial [Paraburkholderia sp.]|nr:tyrosine-protein kinase Etk/Wzc [Paraburkholderia sp.]